MSKGPILIELESEDTAPNPAEVPPVPEMQGTPPPRGHAMQTIATLSARRSSRLRRWFWGLLVTLIGLVISLAAVDFISRLIITMPIAGYVLASISGLFLLILLIICLREAAAFSRLARIDALHQKADAALASQDLEAARDVSRGLIRLYAGREETRWARNRMEERMSEQFDAESVLELTEVELLFPLDSIAKSEIEAAARQVATVTALVPLALADVFTALASNLRMIRRIAEIYGGRSGTLGSWRLTRAVMTHLVATGAVAVGDDLIGSVAGGSMLSKISRRFGEARTRRNQSPAAMERADQRAAPVSGDENGPARRDD